MRALTTACGAAIGAFGGALGYGALQDSRFALKNDEGAAAVAFIVVGGLAGATAGHARPRRKRGRR